jgi:hypothetical protein
MKNTKKTLYQRERRANPVVRSLEQSSENVQHTMHAQTKLCENVSQNNEQQQESGIT